MTVRLTTMGLVALLLLLSATAQAGHRDASDDVSIEVVTDYASAFPLFPIGSSAEGAFRAYLEARPHERYSVRVRNRSGRRVGLVIAVDGRNIISGKKSYLDRSERMYILGPYQTATYRGWRTGSDRVNRFYFTEVDDSYADAFGDRTAMGVIAAAVFPERYLERRDGRTQPYRKGETDESGSANESLKGSDRAPSAKSGRPDAFEPGTGFGEERYSPSVRVEFEPALRASGEYYIKYEWRTTLCEMGIVACRRDGNRFWDDAYGFAPYPPGRRGYRY